MPMDDRSGVWFECHGSGQPLMITLPLMASHVEIFGDTSAPMLKAWLDCLTPHFRILLADYPGIGRSRDIAPEDLTADRVCADLLSVADAAGFESFAYCGYSWSGSVGLQLAARTERLTALVIGGWPPLGGPYAEILAASVRKIGRVEPGSMAVLRSAGQYRQWSHYYASVIGWPEAEAVGKIRCPKMVFFGSKGDLVEAGLPVNIASIIRARRGELEGQGWTVVEMPGFGHDVIMESSLVVPEIAAFLDNARLKNPRLKNPRMKNPL